MRLAWFSPMPPVPSGIAACSADLVAGLRLDHGIDVYVDEPVAAIARGTRSAHEFVWRHRRAPYDLTVYQLGNSSHHDYLWPYLFRHPGLAVLHDGHLHHARAAALLRTTRATDYRAEFAANHPDASPDLAELAIAGFDNHLYYAWPMTRLVVDASRTTAVHAPEVASRLRAGSPAASVEPIRLGHGTRVSNQEARAARARIGSAWGIPDNATLFGVFGGLSPEKRLPHVLEAFAALLPYSPSARLLLGGAPARHYDVTADVRRRGLDSHVTIAGYLDSDAALTDAIAACDVCLALRWPTAREISGPWLRALAAGRPTVIVDLAHLADVPTLDPRTWTVNTAGHRTSSGGPVAVAIDIVDEDHSLRLAMRRLSADEGLRRALGAEGQRYWEREHSPERMFEDYRRVIALAASRPAPRVTLPSHLVTNGDGRLQALLTGMRMTTGQNPAGDALGPERWGRL